MSLFFGNPELLRNARIQVRPGRLIVGTLIAAITSIVVWESVMHAGDDFDVFGLKEAGGVFALIACAQAGILLVGGGIACLLSVQREKELNTFDYQRLTRLTPLELTVGKLLGAPMALYVGVLLLLPTAIFAAARAHISGRIVLEVYFFTLVGCVTYHALALLISVWLGRIGLVFAILLYVGLVIVTGQSEIYNRWTVQSLSPFYFAQVLTRYAYEATWPRFPWLPLPWDYFLGQHVAHWVVFLVIHVTLTAWFLVAIRRNLKRDPSFYAAYSPLQALAFALYICVLITGFFPWTTVFVTGPFRVGQFTFMAKAAIPNSVEQELLQASVLIFGALGLVLVRNRERTRRRVRLLGESATGWVAAVWPVPYLVVAVAAFGGTVVFLINRHRNAGSEWNLRLAIYEAAFMMVWLARDCLYLQWMAVRRNRRAFLSAFLYLAIFYTALGALFSTMDFYSVPRKSAYTALAFPTPIFGLNPYFWGQERNLWIGALLFQIGTAIILAGLYRQRLQELTA